MASLVRLSSGEPLRLRHGGLLHLRNEVVPLGDYFAEVSADGPTAFWMMDQTGSSNPVDSVAGRTTNLNAPYTWSTGGPLGAYLDLTSGGYATFTRIANSGSNTREAIVRTTSTDTSPLWPGEAGLTILGDTSGGVWDGWGIEDGVITFRRYDHLGSSVITLQGTTPVNDGAWHHLAMVYNAADPAFSSQPHCYLYVDGVLETDDGFGGTNASYGGVDAIGRGYDIGDQFPGDLCGVAYYSAALSGARIAAHAAAAGF